MGADHQAGRLQLLPGGGGEDDHGRAWCERPSRSNQDDQRRPDGQGRGEYVKGAKRDQIASESSAGPVTGRDEYRAATLST